MLDIVKLSEDLRSKLQHETDILMSERLMIRDVLEARARELSSKREDELRRVDEWANQQKSLIKEIFSALLAEIEADRQRNDANLARMKGESTTAIETPTKASGKNVRHLRAAE
ncbi:MAG: hypothetical protein KDK89_19450 [Alphaproteobacteria bacterium]|nr:hypothetical protein [Alphaproteobacteria bacterium]